MAQRNAEEFVRATTSARNSLFLAAALVVSVTAESSIGAAKDAAASGSTPILIARYEDGAPAYLAALAADGSRAMRPLAVGRGCAGINNGAWSPNHERVAFTRGGNDCPTGTRLYVKDMRGGPEWRIDLNGVHSAGIKSVDWAPNSRRLVYDDGGRLLVATFRGTGSRVVVRGNSASEPAWSPDGKQIAYVRITGDWGIANQLWVVRPDGTHRRRLTTTGDAFISELGWSADSKRIVFDASGGKFPPGIYIIGRDRRGRRLIAAGGASAADMPQWAPRGTALAYRLRTDCGLSHNKESCGRIVVRRNLASRPKPIEAAAGAEHGREFAWSPDATRIVFGRSKVTESGDVKFDGLYVKTLGRARLTLVSPGDDFILDW